MLLSVSGGKYRDSKGCSGMEWDLAGCYYGKFNLLVDSGKLNYSNSLGDMNETVIRLASVACVASIPCDGACASIVQVLQRMRKSIPQY